MKNEWERCPHDGGACHHRCKVPSACFRYLHGMSLSTPFEGYPLPGYEPTCRRREAIANAKKAREKRKC